MVVWKCLSESGEKAEVMTFGRIEIPDLRWYKLSDILLTERSAVWEEE